MSIAVTPKGPTLAEIRGWPATVGVEQAASAFGVSRAHAYESIKTGTLPVQVLTVGRRIRVTTASILAALGDDSQQGEAA